MFKIYQEFYLKLNGWQDRLQIPHFYGDFTFAAAPPLHPTLRVPLVHDTSGCQNQSGKAKAAHVESLEEPRVKLLCGASPIGNRHADE